MLSETFPMLWRLNDPAYAVLPPETLAQIGAVDPTTASANWHRSVSAHHSHIMEFKAAQASVPGGLLQTNWDEPQQTRAWLRDIGIPEAETVMLFWSPTICVSLPWRTICDYWDDFFYPSDDNNVVVTTNSNRGITYCEERIVVYSALPIYPE